MKTIIITSQKGGSGKTTLASHLAVEAGRDAWLIDTDHQGTLTRWHERRRVDIPQRGEVRVEHLGAGLAALAAQGASYCFVDTAPTISAETARLVEFADLVLIPVRPSPADLWAVVDTVQLVTRAGRPFLFVITQAKANASITAQAVAALSEHGRVARAMIADRVVYAAAMTGGDTAPALSRKAADEVTALWEELKGCFQEKALNQPRQVIHG